MASASTGWPRPMLATATGSPPEGGDWSHEFKWDGVRALLLTGGDGTVELRSRTLADVTVSYPELGAVGAALPPGVLLDGEIVALDAAGRPSFGLLQQRMHVSSAAKAATLSRSVPARFFAFDLLRAAGRDLTGRPWTERRAALEELGLDLEVATTTPAWTGHGAEVLQASVQASLEGVVSKRVDAAYEAGRRSRNWLKTKNIRTQEVVVGGFRPGSGRRSDSVGSLLVGVPGAGGLTYAGHVGTGFTHAMLTDLAGRLNRIRRDRPPFDEELPREHSRDAVWVEPELVGEVVFTEWTADGRMRHPSWRGLRPDKDPTGVTRES